MEPLEIVHRRMRAQRLAGPPFASPAEAVTALGAVQSQEFAEAKWALAQRCGHPGDEEIERAFDAGEILRTHVLRPTWHFVAAEDLGWLLRLTGPRLARGDRSRLRQLELGERLLARAGKAVVGELEASGPRTRPELRERLAARGIALNASQMGHAC